MTDPGPFVAVLPCTAMSAALGRKLTAERCLEWGTPSLCSDLALVVTELVADAVRHAGTGITVRLTRLGDGVGVGVADGSTWPLRPRTATRADEGGRGLLLVDALSSRCGVEPDRNGKLVWAELLLELST